MSACPRYVQIAAAALALALGCDASPVFDDRVYSTESGGDAGAAGRGAASDAGPDEPEPASDAAAPSALPCIPAQASDELRARSSALGRARSSGAAGVFTSDLFNLFQSNCGACHVDNRLGGFEVSLLTFPTTVSSAALERMRSDEEDFYMPPPGAGGAAFSRRSKDDPVVELANLLEAWLAAGRPADVFYPERDDGAADGGGYLLSETVGSQMTNLGNCIPPKEMIGREQEDASEIDAMFAEASELPERLEQTDLTTLDSEALARRNVIAFAPAYTLWADNAKKIRMLRTPVGSSIRFDRERQEFEIPANTRFYKTFLKKVIDLRGNDSYRKLETRLIVSRPDERMPDGSTRHGALFGTYAWNEAETEAVLVRDPLRNGKPFRDRLITYVTDEKAAEDVIAEGPDNLQHALEKAGLTRTYAIPGSERCIQCHMGSPMANFVLGFTPLQVHRQPLGERGVIEPAERDELSQLQRLIDYGVITEMASPDEVVLLDASQQARAPRNDHELAAQGYMLGNCAHCHNPRGYPSVIAPELSELLDFMPSERGGIFQFPLERFSPRIYRGVYQNVPQPYITPSLHDRPNGRDLPGAAVGEGDPTNYLSKSLAYVFDPEDPSDDVTQTLPAPWRSLIYRNVDTPFSYEEDFSIYPHMPMNTPGYDCRARQLLGSWMVSVPARLKPGANADGSDEEGPAGKLATQDINHPEAQPYVEVLPSDRDYSRQRRAGEARVGLFEQSMRYRDCPDPSVDIVDPAVVRGEILVPQAQSGTLADEDGALIGGYTLRTPQRPHYAVTDLTNPPGEWFPRRPDWHKVLVELDLTGLNATLEERVQMLQQITVTDALRELALKEVPFGLWQARPECDFSAVPTLRELGGDARPLWADIAPPPEDAPVYMVSPGAQVFTTICSHCHGPQADSAGRLAATIADMTGGQTRVANLRDGIFGPVGSAGENRERVFATAAGTSTSASASDWAARYLVFMGLGGTQRTIPKPALQTIRNGTVLGVARTNPGALNVTDANMLSVPIALCKAVLPGAIADFLPHDGDLDFSENAAWKSPLIASNGDAELWRVLCSVDNEPVPVRVVTAELKTHLAFKIASPFFGSLRKAAGYPPDAPVGNLRGPVEQGITEANRAPWCLLRPSDPELLALVERELAQIASAPPYCPDAFIAAQDNLFSEQDAERWATRGAMNAGLAVFVYLDALVRGDVRQPIRYDRCEELAAR